MPQTKHFLRIEFSAHVASSEVVGWLPAFSQCGIVAKADEHTYFVEVQRNSKYEDILGILGRLERTGSACWAEIPEQNMREIQALTRPHDATRQTDLAEASSIATPNIVVESQPIRRRLNAAQKRALKAAELRRFVEQYGRGASPGYDPNDRGYDRELEQKVKRMSPDQLDRLLRDDED